MRQHTRLPRNPVGQVVLLTLMDQQGWWWWCQADHAYVRRAICGSPPYNLGTPQEIDVFPCPNPSVGCGWEHHHQTMP